MKRSLPRSSWRQRLAVLTAGVAVVAYVGFLLHSNYRSQVDLRARAMDQLANKAHESAMAVDYFLLERRNDLSAIAESRPLLVFFENKALGMSMDYGLRSSLLAVLQEFRRIVDARRVGSERIYERIAFIDTDGNLLVDTEQGVDPPAIESQEKPSDIGANGRGPYITTLDSAGRFQLQVIAPYRFKGTCTGRVVAWITLGILERHLLKDDPAAARFAGLLAPGGACSDGLYARAARYGLELADSAGFEAGRPRTIETTDEFGKAATLVAVGVPLQAGPLTLVQALPAAEVLGDGSPRQLLGVMGLVSLLILCGAAYAIRSNMRNLLLQTKLTESAQREAAVQEANRQLKIEIAARQRAEGELQQAHDRLEERVRQRTAELSDANNELERQMAERKRLEAELLLSQKMESIGHLAAGVAHEINTPVQYVGDNLGALAEFLESLHDMCERYAALARAVESNADPSAALAAVRAAEVEHDLAYVLADAPEAVSQSLDGIKRVAHIVQAMKDFSHIDRGEACLIDINKALDSALTVARNEYKYVADIKRDFEDVPWVECHAGEMNQVFLNLLVNAAHAIADTGGHGCITVGTRAIEDGVEIRVADTGTGIPADVRDKIFEPFFTTKEIGRGTGQGLYIAHQIITQRHGGSISFETAEGEGTTFILRLPAKPRSAGSAQTVEDVDSPAARAFKGSSNADRPVFDLEEAAT